MPSRALAAAVLVAFSGLSIARGAEPPSGGGSSGELPTDTSPGHERNLGTSPFGGRGDPQGVILDGVVRDSSGRPMAGLPVRLYGSGTLAASATTDESGAFRITGNPLFGAQRTVDLWFISADPSRWTDAQVILSASRVDRERGLLSPCAPVVSLLGNAATVEVTMWSPEERKAEIAKSRCLEEGAAK